MKKFIKFSLLFVCFTAAVYILGIVVFGQFLPLSLRLNLPYNLGGVGYSYTRFNEANRDKDVDILVIGSSHAYRGYDPRIFQQSNWKMFNLGSSAQTPVQTEYVLNKYLHKLNPKLVIIDVYPILFKSDGVESVLDLLSNTTLDDELVSLSVKQNDVRVYNTLVYSYFKNIFDVDSDFKENLLQKNGDAYIERGFVQSNYKFKSKSNYEGESYTFSSPQMNAFRHIINKLNKSNIPYIILQSPIPKKKYQSIKNNEEADSVFAEYGFYQNANEALTLPDSCFIDESHLNQTGVNIYNKYVVDLINKYKKKQRHKGLVNL